MNGHSEHNDDVEKGRMEGLDKIRTATSVNMSSELFEKLYLSPPNRVKGDLRKTFGNPTPMALVGFVLSLMPLACDLMGWRGAGGLGAATIPVFLFLGGVLMLLSGILEWVLGNSFPCTVFCTFGCFWLSLGGTLNPSFSAYAFYAPPDATSPAAGLTTRGFNASFGFWLLAVGILAFLFLICALRTNVVFVIIFATLVPAVGLLNGAFWLQAEDYTVNQERALNLMKAAGALLFVTCAAGWYILAAIMLAIVDFPLQLPVGDLSSVIKGHSEKTKDF